MNFSIEESKENDLIIKAATGNIKTRVFKIISEDAEIGVYEIYANCQKH